MTEKQVDFYTYMMNLQLEKYILRINKLLLIPRTQNITVQ